MTKLLPKKPHLVHHIINNHLMYMMAILTLTTSVLVYSEQDKGNVLYNKGNLQGNIILGHEKLMQEWEYTEDQLIFETEKGEEKEGGGGEKRESGSTQEHSARVELKTESHVDFLEKESEKEKNRDHFKK